MIGITEIRSMTNRDLLAEYAFLLLHGDPYDDDRRKRAALAREILRRMEKEEEK